MLRGHSSPPSSPTSGSSSIPLQRGHRREWTHTLDSGKKEQRIHRRRQTKENIQHQEEEENDEEERESTSAVNSSSPLIAGRRASRRQSSSRSEEKKDKKEEDEEENENEDEPHDNDQDADEHADADVDMSGGPLESDDAPSAVSVEDESASLSRELSAALLGALEESLADPTSIQSLLAAYRSALISTHESTASFESFQHLIASLRELVHAGVSELLDQVIDPVTGAITAANGDARTKLHHVRLTFAKTYPLPESTWLEWLEDVQTIGSGLHPRATLDEHATSEEIEADQDANTQQEQHFLISLYRIALCDYFSPKLWLSFLSYIHSVADRLLATPKLQQTFRAIASEAIWPDGWQQERKRRKEIEEKKKKDSKKERKGKHDPEEKKSSEEEEEEDNHSEDDDDDDDDEDNDEFSDADPDDDADGDASMGDSVSQFNPFATIHPALLPLVPLPYAQLQSNIQSSSSSPSSFSSHPLLPSPIPVAYSFDDGDEIFQKLRLVEMKILTNMMRRLQAQQNGSHHADDSNQPIDQDDIEDQMERVSRLYRIQLKIPMKGENNMSMNHSIFDNIYSYLSCSCFSLRAPLLSFRSNFCLRILHRLACEAR